MCILARCEKCDAGGRGATVAPRESSTRNQQNGQKPIHRADSLACNRTSLDDGPVANAHSTMQRSDVPTPHMPRQHMPNQHMPRQHVPRQHMPRQHVVPHPLTSSFLLRWVT
jgi:hypothetical protein